jgi:hypothetical protein
MHFEYVTPHREGMNTCLSGTPSLSYLLQSINLYSRRDIERPLFGDLSPEVLIPASLAHIISGRIRICAAVTPALS